jgi:hypothetical protein
MCRRSRAACTRCRWTPRRRRRRGWLSSSPRPLSNPSSLKLLAFVLALGDISGPGVSLFWSGRENCKCVRCTSKRGLLANQTPMQSQVHNAAGSTTTYVARHVLRHAGRAGAPTLTQTHMLAKQQYPARDAVMVAARGVSIHIKYGRGWMQPHCLATDTCDRIDSNPATGQGKLV